MYTINIKELKKKMIDLDISTVQKLSEHTNIGRNTLSCILNQKKYPTINVINKLISGLNLTPEEASNIFFNPNLRNK